jgi:hypothetical protein
MEGSEMLKSDEIDKLSSSLSKLQGEITDAHKDKKGYGYNYADLSQVLDIARPLLAKHGLSVTQLLYSEEERMGVETCLLHESGQWLSSSASMMVERSKGMSLAQSAGSVITYLRRYALAAMIGICQTDNDARVEVSPPLTIVERTPQDLIGKLILLAQNPKNSEIIKLTLKKYKVEFVEELPEMTLSKLINHIENSTKEAANV